MTTNTYTGADLTAVDCDDQSGAGLSAARYLYDAYGRRTQEKHWVSGGRKAAQWKQTDYADFAPCGEPQTTTAYNVKLSAGSLGQTLTRTSTYDALGNLTSETDWGGRTTTTNTYDIAGRTLTSTDAAGVTTHSSYDRMGNATESYTTAPGTQMKCDWTTTTYDAVGRELVVTTKRSDANGNPTTDSATPSIN